MALTTPILNPVVAWDVNDGQTLYFNVIGGDAIDGHQIVVRDNVTNEIVYDATQLSTVYSAHIPPSVPLMNNGGYYNAIVKTKKNTEFSLESNQIQFYCYSKPSWEISGISPTVTKSSIAPTINYNQAEGELLSDYAITLYDSQYLVLATSGTIYADATETEFTATYDFFGLEDNTQYFLKATGHTVEGTALETTYIGFVTEYGQPETYNVLDVFNNCEEGYIVYRSLAYSITGTPHGDVQFVDSPWGKLVDLYSVDGSKSVVFDEGLHLLNDFVLRAWFYKPNKPIDNMDGAVNLITLGHKDGNNQLVEDIIINLYWDFGNEDLHEEPRINAEAIVDGTYFIFSDFIYYPPTYGTDSQTALSMIELKRIDNLYDIRFDLEVEI